MESASGRLVAGLAVLVAVWIGAYWLYDPRRPGDESITKLTPDGGLPPAARNANAAEDLPRPAARPTTWPSTTPTDPGTTPIAPSPNPEPLPVVPDPKPIVPKPAVDKPEFDMYAVQPGDTFEKIAKARLGSASLASAIKQANPMKDPRRLRAGDQIRIPRDPANVQGKPAAPTTAPSTSGETYTVMPGDTLSGIAAKLLGSSKHWQLILDANPGTLESPDKLRAGMKLRIPRKPQ